MAIHIINTFLILFTVEAKKRRSGGHQAKEPVPESTKCVFVTFLSEAGITLRQDSTPNEIGKTLALKHNTLVD